jgi:nucleoside-diphosphate-sugar epimerase
VMRLMGSGIAKGRLLSIGSPAVPLTYVLSADVARCLAEAMDAEGVEGERIDIGWNRPLSMGEVARISSDVLGREIRVRTVPWWLLNLVLGAVGRFSGQAADIREMVRYFQSGRYVADVARQREAFGHVPTAEEGVARWLREAALAPAAGSVAASAGVGQGQEEEEEE